METHGWFPRSLRLWKDHQLVLSKKPRTLTLPFKLAKVNSVQQTLILLACKLSVNLSLQEAFRKELPKSYHNPGEGVYKQMVTVLHFKGSLSIQSHSNTSCRLKDRSMWRRSRIWCYKHFAVCLSQVVHIPSGVSFGELSIVKEFSKRFFSTKTCISKIHCHLGPFHFVNLFEEFARLLPCWEFYQHRGVKPFFGDSEHGGEQFRC